VIHIVERQPALVWQIGNDRYLLDASGVVMAVNPPEEYSRDLPSVNMRDVEAPQVGGRVDAKLVATLAQLLRRAPEYGLPVAALAYHRRFHDLYVQVASESSLTQARAMAVKYDTEKAHAVAAAQSARADRLESSHTSLEQQAQTLARLSLEDALTGIGNRRRFDQTLRGESENTDPTRRFSLALLDIDHFKHINDVCSHQVGDAVLRRIGAILAASCRRDDIPARYGGEEFALILVGLSSTAARQVCERVRLAVQNEDWHVLHPALHVTISIGLAHQPEGAAGADVEALLALADRRLYDAKQGGRNRLVDHDVIKQGFAQAET
jgi:diguanylate cyclase (GGDEF)-like protein